MWPLLGPLGWLFSLRDIGFNCYCMIIHICVFNIFLSTFEHPGQYLILLCQSCFIIAFHFLPSFGALILLFGSDCDTGDIRLKWQLPTWFMSVLFLTGNGKAELDMDDGAKRKQCLNPLPRYAGLCFFPLLYFHLKHEDSNIGPLPFEDVVVNINEISFKVHFELFRPEVLDKNWVTELVR